MDNLVRQKFFDVIKQHGWQVIEDYKRFEMLLLEKCGQGPETEALLSAVKEGTALSLMAAKDEEASEELTGDLVKHLEDLGMGTEDAKWAVESLAIALGKKNYPGMSASSDRETSKNKKTQLKWPVIAAGIVLAVCLVAAAAIGIYAMVSGSGASQSHITPTASPEVTPTPTVTPGVDPLVSMTPTAAPESTPTPTTAPQGTTPTPSPNPSGGVIVPRVTPIIPPGNLIAYGNTLPNLLNSGSVAVNEGYIYFRNSSDGGKLYRKPVSGGQSQKLCDDNARYINVIGDWVYYVNWSDLCLYKVKNDGTGRQKVFDEKMYQPVIINDMVYFRGYTNYPLCKRKIGSAASTVLDGDKVHSINPFGGWIYYIKDINGEKQVWKIKYDGTGKQKIANEPYVYSIYIRSNTLLCIDDQHDRLFSLKLDGSSIQYPVNQEHVSDSINFDDQWIYYKNAADNGTLYRIKMDGTGKLKLVNEWVNSIFTGDGWVFYYNSQGRLFKIKPDGTGLSEVQ